MVRSIERCFSCDGELEIRELYCPECDVTIRGRFPAESRGPFGRLTDEQRAFLHLFVTSRGNLSDVERSLGVSYPTVRSKLDELIAAMMDEPPAPPPASEPPAPPSQPTSALNRDEIFARVSRGELTVDEAMSMIESSSTAEQSE